jgi:hypothetical protein
MIGRTNILDNQDDLALGDVCYFADTAAVNGQLVRTRSKMLRKAVIVRNNSGGNLTAGHTVNYDTDAYGTAIGGQATVDEPFDGVIDPDISGAIADDDTFLLFVGGPCTCIVDGAVAGPYVLCGGSGKVKTAIFSTAGACGRTLEDGSAKSDTETMRIFLRCESHV